MLEDGQLLIKLYMAAGVCDRGVTDRRLFDAMILPVKSQWIHLPYQLLTDSKIFDLGGN